MATQVGIVRKNSFILGLGDGKTFFVVSCDFVHDVLFIEPMLGCSISDLAESIAGCFEEESNFYGFKSIEFEFNDVYVSVTPEDATQSKILQLWEEKSAETCSKVEEAFEQLDRAYEEMLEEERLIDEKNMALEDLIDSLFQN